MNSKNTDKMEQILRNITKAQDSMIGVVYWIPNSFLAEFRNELHRISGKMYMDCPEEFDAFIDQYDKYSQPWATLIRCLPLSISKKVSVAIRLDTVLYVFFNCIQRYVYDIVLMTLYTLLCVVLKKIR